MPIMKEVESVFIPFLGEVEVDLMHVVHLVLVLAAGITIGNFFDWLVKR